MPDNQKLSSSMEDYLETILELTREVGRARVRDIALRIGVGKPAVTAALKTLSSKGLLNYAPYKPITLTPEGEQLAAEVQRTHLILQAFLKNVLGLDDDAAQANACRMEHAVDRELLDRIVGFAQHVNQGTDEQKQWLEDFRQQFS